MKALIVNLIAALLFASMLLIPAWHYYVTGLPR